MQNEHSLPRVKRPLFIETPSLRHSPVASVLPTLSLPARSTKCNFDVTIVVDVPRVGEKMLKRKKKTDYMRMRMKGMNEYIV